MVDQRVPPQAMAALANPSAGGRGASGAGWLVAVGSAESVAVRVARFVERTRADELIVSGATYDPAARRRSLELTMKAVS